MWIHHSFGTEYRLWLISESWPTKGAQVRVHIFLPVLHQGYFGSYSLVNVLCWLASAKLRFPEWKLALVSSRDHKIFSFKRGIWLKTGQRALRTSHCFYSLLVALRASHFFYCHSQQRSEMPLVHQQQTDWAEHVNTTPDKRSCLSLWDNNDASTTQAQP